MHRNWLFVGFVFESNNLVPLFIKVKKIMDINSEVYMSRFYPDTYIGVCKDCPEMCGINFNYKENE